MQRLASRLSRTSLTPTEVGTACRKAAVTFLETKPWSKQELAEWLVNAYQFATLRGHGGGVAPKHHGTVSRESVVDLIERVRSEVRDTLDHVLTGDSSFADELVRSGVVAPLKLANGLELYVPMNHRSLRLADRVLSLFAADFFMRRRDYRTRLSVCEVCRKVSFVEECRHAQAGAFFTDASSLVPRISRTIDIEIDVEASPPHSMMRRRSRIRTESGIGPSARELHLRGSDEEELEIAADDIIVVEALAS